MLAAGASNCPRGCPGGCVVAVARGAGVFGFEEATALRPAPLTYAWRERGTARSMVLASNEHRGRHIEARGEQLGLPRADAPLAGQDLRHDPLTADLGQIGLL